MNEIELYQGEGGGGGCFPAGTLVSTPTGFKQIDKLIIGEEVLSFDTNGIIHHSKVLNTFIHSYTDVGYESHLLNLNYEGGSLSVTGNHYIRTPSFQSNQVEDGFCRADQLQIGDIIYDTYGYELRITSITEGTKYAFVYNLEVEDNHTYIASGIRVHNGGGGKGGGGGSAVEAADSLRNNSFVNSLELLSEGQINGLHTGDGQSIFINGTALQNSNASYNFQGATYELRTGTLSQLYIPGFESVTSTVSVGTIVTFAAPVVYTMSSINIDAARVTLTFTNGLKSQDTSNGNINGSAVSYSIYRKLTSSGTWVLFLSTSKSGKSSGVYSWQNYIPRPTGTTGTWDIKVTRNTADSISSSVADQFQVSNVVEIQEVKLAYPGFAYIGISLDARQFGQNIPVRSYLIDGVNIQIPSNYNISTHTFAGLWDGTFITAFSDDPAWVLYNMLTNATYGCGAFGITAAQIDKFSFYNASVFNNALVPDGYGIGGTERRFTFNAGIAQRSDMLSILMNIAGMQNASLAYVNGLVTLIQDRPTAASFVVNKANVVNGLFTYKSTPLNTRSTATNITWTNKANKYLPTVSNITADAAGSSWLGFNGVARYGYNPVNIAAYGATTEGQALRAARWNIYTNLVQKEICEFSMGSNGFQINIGDVVSIFDEDYANQSGAGRVISATSTTITLDRPVVVSGTPSISVVLPDGVTYETHTITNSAGTYSTLTIATAGTTINQQTGVTGTVSAGWSVTPVKDNTYNVTSAIAPRTFRIIDIKQNTSNADQVDFQALLYDINNYTALETGVAIPAGVYTTPQTSILSAPTSLSVVEHVGTAGRSLVLNWVAPSIGVASKYIVKYRRDYGLTISLPDIITTSFEITGIIDGFYEIDLIAISAAGIISPMISTTYSVNTTGIGSTSLVAVTGLQIVGGGTDSTLPDYQIQWTNPAANNNLSSVLAGFEITIKNGSTIVRVQNLPPVQPGVVTSFIYLNATNTANNGGIPIRSINVEVRCVDTSFVYSTATTATFTNTAPAVPSTITFTPGFENVTVTTSNSTTPADFVGMVIWGSTTTGFTPSQANILWQGPGKIANISSILNTTYFYRVAWYDTFNTNNLSLSAEINATTLNAANTNEYHLNGVTWTPNSPGVNQVAWSACTAFKSQGTGLGSSWAVSAGNVTWTSGILYIYYTEGGSILQSTTTLSTAIANNKIIVATYRGGTSLEHGDGNAYTDGGFIIAGTIGAAQLVVGSAVITQSAQIADAVITTAKIGDLQVDTLKLKNGSVSSVGFTSLTNKLVIASISLNNPIAGNYSFIWSDTIVANLTFTSPNPSGITGPFLSFLQAYLYPSIELNLFNASLSGMGIALSYTPLTYYIQILQGSTVISTSTVVTAPSGSNLNVANSNLFTSAIQINNSTGQSPILFYNPSFNINTQYTINLILKAGSGAVAVTQSAAGGSISGTISAGLYVPSRGIYYQSLLR